MRERKLRSITPAVSRNAAYSASRIAIVADDLRAVQAGKMCAQTVVQFVRDSGFICKEILRAGFKQGKFKRTSAGSAAGTSGIIFLVRRICRVNCIATESHCTCARFYANYPDES